MEEVLEGVEEEDCCSVKALNGFERKVFLPLSPDGNVACAQTNERVKIKTTMRVDFKENIVVIRAIIGNDKCQVNF